MRNLAKYPATRQEIVEALKKSSDDYAAYNIPGDMRGYLHRLAHQMIERKINEDDLTERCLAFIRKASSNRLLRQGDPVAELYDFILSEIEEATKIE